MTTISEAKELIDDIINTPGEVDREAAVEALELIKTALDFYENYQNSQPAKKPITDKGIPIILALREVEDWITAKALGERMDISGRSVSGSLKKLVTDGYVDKRAGSPAAYKITDKGMNCDLEIE